MLSGSRADGITEIRQFIKWNRRDYTNYRIGDPVRLQKGGCVFALHTGERIGGKRVSVPADCRSV